MNLSSLFPQQKTLAKVPTAPASPALKELYQQSAPKPSKVPGTGPFTIVWPKPRTQGAKDYQVITTPEALRAYLQRCRETGYASFDWETAPSDETRARYAAKFKDLDIRRLAAQEVNTKLLPAIDKEAEKLRKEFRETPLDPHKGEICTFSVAAAPDEARVVFLSHKRGSRNFAPELSRAGARTLALNILDELIFKDRKTIKIAFNLQFEAGYAVKYRKYILSPVADPLIMRIRCLMVASPKKIRNYKAPYEGQGLKAVTKETYGVTMTDFTTLLAKAGVEFFDEMDTDDPATVTYSAEDSDYGLQHYQYWDEVALQIPCNNQKFRNYSEWLAGIECPFTRVLGLMEYKGLAWDTDLADIKRQEAETKVEEAQQEIINLAKDYFNIDVNPGKQGKTGDIRKLVFETLGLPIAAYTKTAAGKPTNNPSLDGNAILDMIFMLENNLLDIKEERYLGTELPEDWESRDPDTDPELNKDQRQLMRILKRQPHKYRDQGIALLKVMQRIQDYSTLVSSHIVGRGKWVNEMTGRIHALFDQWARTSRTRSRNPNGQNVPRPDNDVFGIRGFYKAQPGKVLMFIDKSGFELRLMAWRSACKVMINAFRHNEDLHKKTAATMTGKPEAEVIKHERSIAKAGNFGICYGGTEYALQGTFKEMGIRKSLPECAAVVTAVKVTYPGIPEYQREIVLDAREKGYVETIYGYIRLLDHINSPVESVRRSDERRAQNTPIQGSAADLMKDDQNAVYDWVGENDLDGHVDQCQQIHDEIIFELDDDPALVKMVHDTVKAIMERLPWQDFPVPMEAEASLGYNWKDKMSLSKWLETKGVA